MSSENGMLNSYSPTDPELIDKIVNSIKAKGIFDQFRKDCLADVDTKPAYQNLQQRVNGTVTGYLATQRWQHTLNKTQLRESLRRHTVQQAFLEVGVDRIVDQVVNPKIYSVFMPKVEDVVCECLGIEKPKPPVVIENPVEVVEDPADDIPAPVPTSPIAFERKPEVTPEIVAVVSEVKPPEPSTTPTPSENKDESSAVQDDLAPVSPQNPPEVVNNDDDSNTIDEMPLLAPSLDADSNRALTPVTEAPPNNKISDLSNSLSVVSSRPGLEYDSATNNLSSIKSEAKISSTKKFDNFSNLGEKLKQSDVNLRETSATKKTEIAEESSEATKSSENETESSEFKADLPSESNLSSLDNFERTKEESFVGKIYSEESQSSMQSLQSKNKPSEVKDEKAKNARHRSERKSSSSKSKEIRSSKIEKENVEGRDKLQLNDKKESHKSYKSSESKSKSKDKFKNSREKDLDKGGQYKSSKDKSSHSSGSKSGTDSEKHRKDKLDVDDKEKSGVPRATEGGKSSKKKDDDRTKIQTKNGEENDSEKAPKGRDRSKGEHSKSRSDSSSKSKDKSKSDDKKRSSKKRKIGKCDEDDTKMKSSRRSSDRDSNGNAGVGGTSKSKSSSSSQGDAKSSKVGKGRTSSKGSGVKEETDNAKEDESEGLENTADEVELMLLEINNSIDENQRLDVNELRCESSVKKPKIARNFHEIKKIMQARKNIDRMMGNNTKDEPREEELVHNFNTNEMEINDTLNSSNVVSDGNIRSGGLRAEGNEVPIGQTHNEPKPEEHDRILEDEKSVNENQETDGVRGFSIVITDVLQNSIGRMKRPIAQPVIEESEMNSETSTEPVAKRSSRRANALNMQNKRSNSDGSADGLPKTVIEFNQLANDCSKSENHVPQSTKGDSSLSEEDLKNISASQESTTADADRNNTALSDKRRVIESKSTPKSLSELPLPSRSSRRLNAQDKRSKSDELPKTEIEFNQLANDCSKPENDVSHLNADFSPVVEEMSGEDPKNISAPQEAAVLSSTVNADKNDTAISDKPKVRNVERKSTHKSRTELPLPSRSSRRKNAGSLMYAILEEFNEKPGSNKESSDASRKKSVSEVSASRCSVTEGGPEPLAQATASTADDGSDLSNKENDDVSGNAKNQITDLLTPSGVASRTNRRRAPTSEEPNVNSNVEKGRSTFTTRNSSKGSDHQEDESLGRTFRKGSSTPLNSRNKEPDIHFKKSGNIDVGSASTGSSDVCSLDQSKLAESIDSLQMDKENITGEDMSGQNDSDSTGKRLVRVAQQRNSSEVIPSHNESDEDSFKKVSEIPTKGRRQEMKKSAATTTRSSRKDSVGMTTQLTRTRAVGQRKKLDATQETNALTAGENQGTTDDDLTKALPPTSTVDPSAENCTDSPNVTGKVMKTISQSSSKRSKVDKVEAEKLKNRSKTAKKDQSNHADVIVNSPSSVCDSSALLCPDYEKNTVLPEDSEPTSTLNKKNQVLTNGEVDELKSTSKRKSKLSNSSEQRDEKDHLVHHSVATIASTSSEATASVEQIHCLNSFEDSSSSEFRGFSGDEVDTGSSEDFLGFTDEDILKATVQLEHLKRHISLSCTVKSPLKTGPPRTKKIRVSSEGVDAIPGVREESATFRRNARKRNLSLQSSPDKKKKEVLGGQCKAESKDSGLCESPEQPGSDILQYMPDPEQTHLDSSLKKSPVKLRSSQRYSTDDLYKQRPSIGRRKRISTITSETITVGRPTRRSR